MCRFSATMLVCIAVGFIPLPASADPNNIDDNAPALGSLKDSEKLGQEAQRELARLGCFSGDVNENWGREGRAAIKRFNQNTKFTWPDWPTVDLINSLRNYADGYCRQCREGDSCAAPTVEAEKQPAAVSSPVQAPPPAAPAPVEETPVAVPVEKPEQVSPPPAPSEAKSDPQETPQESADEPASADTESKSEEPETAEDREPVANQRAKTRTSRVKTAPPPKPTPAPAPPPAPRPSSRSGGSGVSGGGWPGGPNLDGR